MVAILWTWPFGDWNPSTVIAVAVFVSAAVYVVVFLSFFRVGIPNGMAFGMVLASSALLIATFSLFYTEVGILCAGAVCPDPDGRAAVCVSDCTGVSAGPVIAVHDRVAAFYFSVVTFTTLGYGDFQPLPEYRLVAAAQAVLGYVVLGLVVGITIDWCGQTQKRPRISGPGGHRDE